VNSSKLVETEQESRAVARKPRNVAAVLFSLQLADNIHYKFQSSQASKAGLHSSKHIATHIPYIARNYSHCATYLLLIVWFYLH